MKKQTEAQKLFGKKLTKELADLYSKCLIKGVRKEDFYIEPLRIEACSKGEKITKKNIKSEFLKWSKEIDKLNKQKRKGKQ